MHFPRFPAIFRLVAFLIAVPVLALRAQEASPPPSPEGNGVKATALPLFDQARARPVPVVVYTDGRADLRRLKPAIISHGYQGENTAYSFIAAYLATHGYYVVSIQHEIPGDEPLPAVGVPSEVRRPSWERGVQNILFVLDDLKRRQPELDYGHVLLVGHSHGGDTSMLFAQEHPALVDTVISLDNRRMPFPRAASPRLLSIRSCDQSADEGVIPTAEEQARYGMRVVKLPDTIHNDMWDGATPEQKAGMIHCIDEFLHGGEQGRH